MVACCLCLYAEAAGTKANAVEKTVAISVAKVDAAAKVVANAKVVAEKGDAAAQFRYAEMLRDGRGVVKNMREHDAGRSAIALLRRAAVQDRAGAIAKLQELGCTILQAQEKVAELNQR